MDMESRLRQKIRDEQKLSIIIGVVICVILSVLLVILVTNRATEADNENTKTSSWLNFGIIALSIILIVVFTKYILFVLMDSKKDLTDSYESLKIIVLQVSTKMNLLYGTWRTNALVENIETHEQFLLEGCGDMKENKIYCMLRAKHSKLFVYEIFDDKL